MVGPTEWPFQVPPIESTFPAVIALHKPLPIGNFAFYYLLYALKITVR